MSDIIICIIRCEKYKYKKKLFYNNVYHSFINSIHLEYMNDIGWAVYTYMEYYFMNNVLLFIC